jgi:2-(1,2-epoxy-1,2-dihydrophenyl)acetyl-CoA isomerase
MTEPLVLAELRGDVAIIRLNDPDSLNAMSLEMADELVVALGKASSTCRAIIVTGVGRGFCSGAKLSVGNRSATGKYDPGDALEVHYNPLMLALKNLPIPLVMAVNGAAAGIGAPVALAGDIIIASEKAYFLEAFRNVGLVPDGASSFLLTRAVGRVRAMEMMLLGERVSAATALEWGMINRVVAPEALIRKQCWESLEIGFEAQLASEVDLQNAASRTRDHREGLAAFLQKRPAAFTGE